jgi:hypothetical protein
MRRLPKNKIEIYLSADGKYVIASMFEDNGYRHYEKYRLSDLPNDLISFNDLKSIGINIIDRKTV